MHVSPPKGVSVHEHHKRFGLADELKKSLPYTGWKDNFRRPRSTSSGQALRDWIYSLIVPSVLGYSQPSRQAGTLLIPGLQPFNAGSLISFRPTSMKSAGHSFQQASFSANLGSSEVASYRARQLSGFVENLSLFRTRALRHGDSLQFPRHCEACSKSVAPALLSAPLWAA
jgi:hypothetical protein